MTSGEPLLAPGDTGEWVLRLQARLHALGLLEVLLDGSYTDATKAAVMTLQEQHALTADGVVGVATWAALTAAEQAAGLQDPFAQNGPMLATADPAAPPVGTMSEDQQWRWDGEGWQRRDTAVALADDPQENHPGGGQLSADRQWLWDGTRWQPVAPEDGTA
jgi:hypothetical protein